MATNENSTRAGRSIENLDDRKNAVATDPGSGTTHGRAMPRYKDDILIEEETAALDHVQVSNIGDIGEGGHVLETDETPPDKKP
jgi:hypothetical protein